MKGADGRPVNALLGTVNTLLAESDENEARAVVAAFGPDAAAYRTELYPAYHAHRPPMPPDLAHQWKRAPDLCARSAGTCTSTTPWRPTTCWARWL